MATTIIDFALSTTLGVIVALALIVLLAVREVASASHSDRSLRIARFAGVGIIPLLIAFVAIIVLHAARVIVR